MDQLELVKTLTGLTNLDSDIAAFYLSLAEQFILDYCGIETLPNQLVAVKVQIAAKMIQENTSQSGTKGAAGEVKGAASSLTDGNQSVSYQLGGEASASFTYNQASIVSAFGYMLNRYRKLKHDGHVCDNNKRGKQVSEVEMYRTPTTFII